MTYTSRGDEVQRLCRIVEPHIAQSAREYIANCGARDDAGWFTDRCVMVKTRARSTS
jgi:hypothetical protein